MGQPLSDLIAHLDLFDKLDQWLGAWLHRRWSKRWREAGLGGVLGEAAQVISGQSAWRFYIMRESGWSGWQVERFLSQYGIAIWGRGFDAEHLFFSVKTEQANWAEYLLKRRGIPVLSQVYNTANDAYPALHPPGSVPPPGGRPKHNWLADLFDLDGK